MNHFSVLSPMKLIFIQVILLIGISSAAPTFWNSFAELNSTALPGSTAYNSIRTMVVDESTTPFTAYFTAYRQSIGTAQMYKLRMSDGKILAQNTLPVSDPNPQYMVMDPVEKMLYYVPIYSRLIVKFNPSTMSEVARLDLSQEPHLFTDHVNKGVLDAANRTIIFSVNTSPGKLVKLDLNTFNLTGTPLIVANASYLSYGEIDPSTNMAYFSAVTVPTKVAQIDLVKWENIKVIELYEDYYGYPYQFLNVGSTVIDTLNKYMYVADTSDPGRIARINITPKTFAHVETLRLSYGERAPSTMLLDQTGGNMIVGCNEAMGLSYMTPERVVQVDLRLFRRVFAIETKDYEAGLYCGAFDPVSRTCYFGTNRASAWNAGADVVIRVSVPAPCGGDVHCSGHGVCDYGACQCSGGLSVNQLWSGVTCDTLTCPTGALGKVCSGNGLCNNGTCVCTHDSLGHTAFGVDCFNLTCPNKCNGHGLCNPATLTCSCGRGWKGADCSQVVPPRPPCHELLSCTACFKDPSCGWCESSKNGSRCMDGTFISPGECYDWYYDGCPDIGVVVFSWLIVVLTLILLLVGSISAIRDDNAWANLEDEKDPKGKKKIMSRVSWWLGSRTLKGWWMMDRLQMAAVLGIVGSPMPSMYLSFIKPYLWTLLGIQSPEFINNMLEAVINPAAANPAAAPVPAAAASFARSLLSMPQYAAQLTVTAKVGNAIAIFGAAVFYFVILFVGVLLILLIVTFIGYFLGWTEGTDEGPATLPFRIPGILLRIVLFSFTGLTVTASAAAFAQAQNVGLSPAIFAIALVFLVLLGLVLPVVNLLVFISKGMQRKQFQRKYRMMIGCLYENYYFKRAWFGSIYMWKKWLLAVMIGVFSQTSGTAGIACGATIIALAIIYAFLVLVLKPFLDPMMRNLEILGCAADVLAGVCVLFFNPSMGLVGVADEAELNKRNLIATILIVVQIVWVVFGAFAYFENWLRVHNVHSYAQLFKKIVGMRRTAEISGPVAVPMGNVQSTHHLD